jgi:Ca2+/H+ antiporter, TMEM165/GDT1 family
MSAMKQLALLLRELRWLTAPRHAAPSRLSGSVWLSHRSPATPAACPPADQLAVAEPPIVCEHDGDGQGRRRGNPTVNLTLLAAVFGVIFVAELPDKTALVSLVLGTHYRPSFVFIGVATAFALHVIIAVAAGSALSLAPHRVVEALVAALFLAAAALMLRRGEDQPDDHHASWGAPRRRGQAPGPVSAGNSVSAGNERGRRGATATRTRIHGQRAARPGGFWPGGFWHVAATSFGVLFVAEFGDLTQIATANLAAKYHDPLTVGVGAVLGLWTVGGLAILGGRQLLRWVRLTWIIRAAALVMTVLAVISAIHAITG